MRNKILIIGLFFLIKITTTFSQGILNNFTIEAGLLKNVMLGENQIPLFSKVADNNSFYFGINYSDRNAKYPITVGLNISKYNQEQTINIGFEEIYKQNNIYYNQEDWNLRFPIAYNFYRGNSQFSIGLSPNLLIIKSIENINLTETSFAEISQKFDLKGMGNSVGVQERMNNMVMKCDILAAYQYRFGRIKNVNLGIKAFVYYPILKNDPIHFNHQLSLSYKNGDYFEHSASANSSYKPFSLGIAMVFGLK